MAHGNSVVAVSCLTLEARIARGPGVSVLCGHASRVVASLEQAAERGVCGIISFGIAGGLAPSLATGDWVIASGVQTDEGWFPADHGWARRLVEALPGAVHATIAAGDLPIASPSEKRRLHGRSGAVAIDMESHIAARIAAARGIPFAACRVIIDDAHMQLPPAAVIGLGQDGRPDLRAVLRSVAGQPSQLPALVRTARDARIAWAALRRGRRWIGAGLGCPYLGSNSRPDIADEYPSHAEVPLPAHLA